MLLEVTHKIGGRGGGRGFDRERGGEGEATTPSRDGAPVFKIYKVRNFHCLVLLLVHSTFYCHCLFHHLIKELNTFKKSEC